MAERQVFGRDPVTGVPCWRYVDLGPQAACTAHGRPLIKSFVMDNGSRRENGGGQQRVLKGAQ